MNSEKTNQVFPSETLNLLLENFNNFLTMDPNVDEIYFCGCINFDCQKCRKCPTIKKY